MVKLGEGFIDQISHKRESFWPGQSLDQQGYRRFFESRVVPFFAILVFGIGVLFLRLFWLSVVKGGYYRSLSEENRIKEEILWAPRGIIHDRNGKALVLNKPIYREKLKNKYRYLTQEEVLAIEEKGLSKNIEQFVTREYPYGEVFSHVLGYVGEVDQEGLEKGLLLGSLVGKIGIEEAFDDLLRGREGKELRETDALGKKVKALGKVDPQAGEDIITTLDLDLQTKSSELLKEKTGAVIVSRPMTGEILALYSSPSFNPNLFSESKRLSAGSNELETLSRVLDDSARPLFNRAITGLYPPGSTFKIITAIAALEEKAIDEETIFEDKGFIAIGPYKYRNWYYTQYGKVEGEVNIVKGIARSVDTFFYKIGEETGIDKIADWGRKLGIGKVLGIEINGEAKGRMPDSEWKEKAKGDRWYLGDTYHVAIGQGDILATPLQVNFWTSVIANGGKFCQPELIINKEGKRKEVEKIEGKCLDLGISQETIRLISEGMKKACEPGGTGFPLFNFKVDIGGSDELLEIPVACKTGTAEFSDPEERTHAWFTVFAPVKSPEIVVTVLLEAGGSGAYDAAPIAKEILNKYFKSKK